jgi:hypothetical protein
MTTLTRSTSIPRPKMSVATRIRFSNDLNWENREILLVSCMQLATEQDLPFGLGQTRVDADRREVAFLQQGVELSSTSDRLDKDTNLDVSYTPQICSKAHLVELELVEEVVEFSVLLLLLELEEVLLKSVQGQLGLVVNVDFKRLQLASYQRNV